MVLHRLLSGFLLVLTAAPAVGQLGELTLVSPTSGHDRAPRLSGDFVAWTRDVEQRDSWGTIRVHNLSQGQTVGLGDGFLPDVDATPGSDGLLARVAWLRFEADETLSVVRSTWDGAAWSPGTVASGLAYAGRPAVLGELTVWTAPDEQSVLQVWSWDGASLQQISTIGPCFRPTLARLADGREVLAWDAHVGGPGDLDYDVFLSVREGGLFTAPENLSLAPGIADVAPSLAPDPDGSLWLAWRTQRAPLQPRILVARRATDGGLALAPSHPPSADPDLAGLVDVSPDGRANHAPILTLDGEGRPWLFVALKPTAASPYDKQLHWTVLQEAGWRTPELLDAEQLGEVELDADRDGDGLRAVYQRTSPVTRTTDVMLATLSLSEPHGLPELTPPTGALTPPVHDPPLLTAQRELLIDGQPHRLVFADLHAHTGRSPDGTGLLDMSILFARDITRLDALGSTDHDERGFYVMLDWDHARAARLMELFETSGFAIYPGFEWTNDVVEYQGEIVGHRATFDSRRLVRYTDVETDELPEFYAAMLEEDAIGVPHHLGKLGGATFLLHDAQVQPVTEIASVHGIYEDELTDKLLQSGVRFGITAAGDNHVGKPGLNGLAAIWIADDGSPLREALKAGLRARRTYAVRKDGPRLVAHLNGVPAGGEALHAGDLLLAWSLSDLPHEGPWTVSLSRDGEREVPVALREVDGTAAEELVVVPGTSEPAFYILRVTEGLDTAPASTRVWSSPVWVDPDDPADYPTASLLPPSGGGPTGAPLDLVLLATDPQGVGNLAQVTLHVRLDGVALGSLPAWLMLSVFQVQPVPDGWSFTLPDVGLPPGAWRFVLEVSDKQGHRAGAQTDWLSTP